MLGAVIVAFAACPGAEKGRTVERKEGGIRRVTESQGHFKGSFRGLIGIDVVRQWCDMGGSTEDIPKRDEWA